jgi:hypothetical protein
MVPSLSIINGDILQTQCDVVVLKYAQKLYGADRAAALALGLGENQLATVPGGDLLVSARGKLACKNVLFVGVQPLYEFGYAEIRSFARRALAALATADVERESVAMTMHGVGYGLDEREAFTAQTAGLLEYLTDPAAGWQPRTVTIVERAPGRFQRLQPLLQTLLLKSGYGRVEGQPRGVRVPRLPDAGINSNLKKHVFVAMPYSDDMEDTYEFGIKEPVNESGCLCERCDRDVFTGDVLERIKLWIADANVVIADLTGANPNVYLEVGYAWGKGVPTLLIAREGEDLKFDVKAQKCIFYRNITHLRKQLSVYLRGLLEGAHPTA